MKDNIRIVQLIYPEMGRKIAIVSEPNLVLSHGPASVYELAVHVIDSEKSFYSIIENSVSVLSWNTILSTKDHQTGNLY